MQREVTWKVDKPKWTEPMANTFPVPDGKLADIEMYCQMSVNALTGYQYKHSNSVWLLKSKGQFDTLRLQVNGQYLEDATVLIFMFPLRSCGNPETNEKLPIWPDRDGFYPKKDARLQKVLVKAKFSPIASNQAKMSSLKNAKHLEVVYVSKISQYLRTHRIIGIADTPKNQRPQDDPNLSILYDAMIDNNRFNRTMNMGNSDSIETNFESLLASNGPSVIVLDGGPGTGKSTKMTNLLTTQYNKCALANPQKKFKVLVCASSNTAVDVAYMKLAKSTQTALLYRVGKKEKVSSEVREREDEIVNRYRKKFETENPPGTCKHKKI